MTFRFFFVPFARSGSRVPQFPTTSRLHNNEERIHCWIRTAEDSSPSFVLRCKVSNTEMSSGKKRKVYFARAMRVKRLAAFHSGVRRGEKEEEEEVVGARGNAEAATDSLQKLG